MEKKVLIVLGVIMIVFTLMVITKRAIWPFLVVGVLAFMMYKNNRF